MHAQSVLNKVLGNIFSLTIEVNVVAMDEDVVTRKPAEELLKSNQS